MRKEKIIMLASSVLVLTALTVTGVYVNKNNQEEQEDYVLDFDALEGQTSQTAENVMSGEEMDTLFAETGTDDLDYDPSFQEANSLNVENTDGNGDADNTASAESDGSGAEAAGGMNASKKTEDKEEEAGMFDETVDTASMDETEEQEEVISTTVQPALDFDEKDGLVWPIVGDVLINYSMDKTIYFPTLQQYKYNPAIIISAVQGENITAAADGRVTSVAYDPVIGNTVVMDLGNGYELTYGQLDNIVVSEGSYVSVGDGIGTVASPTKYYSLEGTNVYFKLTKDGEPVNPMTKLQ
jgi:murein DD-endopeptidase MepM/ murein hydrolase activator NlpD